MKAHSTLSSALLLGMVAATGIALVSIVREFTEARIEGHARDAPLRRLQAVLSASEYNNDILATKCRIDAQDLGGKRPAMVYVAREDGEPVAVIFDLITPEGYSGPIRLLVGIDHSGLVTGVRVISHRETPGLGDAIEADKSDWIRQFPGHSVDEPPAQEWAVVSDGGAFDQISGATITSRGIVGAIRRALLYFAEHQQDLFVVPTERARSR